MEMVLRSNGHDHTHGNGNPSPTITEQNILALVSRQAGSNPKPAKMGASEQNAAGLLKYVAEQAAPFFQRVDEERFRHVSEWLIFFMPYARVIGGASAFQGSSTRALANCIDEDVSETEQIFFMCMPHFSKSLPKLRAQYEEKDVI